MKTFLFVNMSCHRRQEEILMIRNFLLMNNFMECEDLKQADLIIFFTCGCCHVDVVEMLNKINNIRTIIKNGSELIIGGCLPKTDNESLKKIFDGKTITPTDFSALNNLSDIKIKFETLPKLFGKGTICPIVSNQILFKTKKISLKELVLKAAKFLMRYGPIKTLKRLASRFKDEKHVVILISTGCLGKCSYCAIKFATGDLRSKPLDIIMRQFSEGLKLGYRKFEICGDAIKDYGLDIGTNLGQLFDEILNINEDFSVKIDGLHPQAFLKYFEKIILLCKTRKVHQIYVPLQSGNERILKLMNRPFDLDDFLKKLLEVKKFKRVILYSGVIIGFPSESDEEFEDTLDFLKKVKFDFVHVHFYSDMPNTESSRLLGKIDKDTMLRRHNKILRAAINHDAFETKREWKISQ